MPSTTDYFVPNSFSNLRRMFGVRNIEKEVELDLKKIQVDSYIKFARGGGIEEVFKSMFPVNNENSTAVLNFVKCHLGECAFTPDECIRKGITYSFPLRVVLKLNVFDFVPETGEYILKSQKEQSVYIGEIPMMTSKGTFAINGIEKVIVSQMHRSPGVNFLHDGGRTYSSGRFIYSASIVPYRGSWMDIEFDRKDLLYVRIDRKRKVCLTTFLKALGMSKQDIINYYYNSCEYKKNEKNDWVVRFEPESFKSVYLLFDLVNADTGETIALKGEKISLLKAKKLHKNGLNNISISSESLCGKCLFRDIVLDTGEVVEEAGEEITQEIINKLDGLGIINVSLISSYSGGASLYLRDTLMMDKTQDKEEALYEIYRVLRAGEIPASLDIAKGFFNDLFFNEEKYDLSEVGRVKMNMRLNLECPESVTVLRKEDILRIITILIEMRDAESEPDDIDHLGNRRVRSVGEFMENHFRVGLVRVQRVIKEKMTSLDIDSAMPYDLMNSKALIAVLKDFFNLSQLSQFMDQTNPLSEITHKRRLSALGPGGLTRERAGFEVRDVHTTYYGRICPIETPEGQNIGLINSLATYARVNKYGFIESPFYKVENGIVTDKVEYVSAMGDARFNIAQAGVELDENNRFVDNILYCRRGGNFIMVNRDEVDYIDVSPKQLVSTAASLIPFLENDDSCRALMGTNMQRQAVPLLCTEAPFVGTGMEAVIARGAGAVVVTEDDGVITKVDSRRIVVRTSDPETQECTGVKVYNLSKYRKSNHSTCINQKPIVFPGDKVRKGDVLADGPAIDKSELALGRNVLVAFLSWNGYNFEDSIVVSERLIKEEYFTSVHIEEFECVARDTRLGAEEITRDLPNVNEDLLYNLDDSGIVCIGSSIESGDVVVGKVTPKGEAPLSPEEKLLSAIFGEKCNSFRDASLYTSPGVTGTVIDVSVLLRRGMEKDERSKAIYKEELGRFKKNYEDEIAVLNQSFYSGLRLIILDKEFDDNDVIAKSVTDDVLNSMPSAKWWFLKFTDEATLKKVRHLKEQLDLMLKDVRAEYDSNIEKLNSGDDLPQGTLKVVKVFVAIKRKLQVGDKMAGRHGNKGVISKIVPVEDMPYLKDGTPIDLILNPLGVPSRMNVGQILETHLGWACYNIGKKIRYMLAEKAESVASNIRSLLLQVYESTDVEKDLHNMTDEQIIKLGHVLKNGITVAAPVFEGPSDEVISKFLEIAGVSTSGQEVLYDGRDGEPLDRKVTVGYIYILKLHHLVDEKMHARSVGPYSLVTQQPLGGKSHFGGQRFGEMECWALQAYGAAYTLQEMLTVKSDDVGGRIRVYDSIIKGNNNSFECSVPESFHVLMNEMRSLCLDVELIKEQEDEEDDKKNIEDIDEDVSVDFGNRAVDSRSVGLLPNLKDEGENSSDKK